MSTSKFNRQRKSSRDRNDHARWGWSPSVLKGHNSIQAIPSASSMVTAPIMKGFKGMKSLINLIPGITTVKKGSRGA